MIDAGKRVAAAALFFDDQGRVLLVDPVYQEKWHVPGGIAEDGESPKQACRREVLEELGLDKPIGRMLCTDWIPATPGLPERILFFFDGGTLKPEEIDKIALQAEELQDFTFVPIPQAVDMLPDLLARRLQACMQIRDTPETAYLENGYQVG
ncbi:MAG: NUDIX domain-containing protein [Mycobacteriales bacterium]